MTHSNEDEGVPPFSLQLLGGIELQGIPAESVDKLLAQSKVVALLAYLALAPAGRYQRRDRIVGLLWPDLDQTHARSALRKAVHVVRTSLGDDVLIGRGDEEISLSRERLSCDVRDFNERADEGRLAHALDLYLGELMPGFHLTGCAEFGSWLDQERASIARNAAAVAWALADRLEQSREFTFAGRMARRVVQFEWTDERVLRRAMQMLQRLGDHAGAIRIYEDFARRLRAELDAKPAAETVALADGMRRR